MSVTIIDDVIDSDLSSESDEELKRAIVGIKSPNSAKLESLCSSLMMTRPNKTYAEPSSDDKLLSELTSFSQVLEEEGDEYKFDVEYERAKFHAPDIVSLDKDPLYAYNNCL